MSGPGSKVRVLLPFGRLPNAGVGVVSLRCLPLIFPTSATTSSRVSLTVVGRSGVCCRWVLVGLCIWLFLYGYQGADADPEQLALTEQLFDAALGELSVVSRGQPCLLVGDFNVEPTKIPCLARGISAGLWVDLEVSWALATGKQPTSTCKREWGSGGGTRRDFMIGCHLTTAAVLSCTVQPDRWIAPHLVVRTLFDYGRWSCRVTQPARFSPLWPASWLLAVDKSRSSKSVEVRRVWEIYDDRLQFMSRQDPLLLDESLDAGDVSRAWLVWSGAAETALADAYRFSGGPVPNQGLVLGRGMARFRLVRLVGHRVRKVRGNAADAHDAADVFLYRDSSFAPLLDMRRRFRAVMDILDAMIRCGLSLSRSFELTAQWGRIVAVGPLYPVTLDDLHAVQGLGLGDFHRVVSGIHRRLSDFIHSVVVHRRDEAIRGWRNRGGSLGSSLQVAQTRFDSPQLPFFSVCPISRLVVLGCLLILLGLMRKSETPGFPIFVALGKGIPALRNSIMKLTSGCLFCLRFLRHV